jgi:hypothetical protein
MADRVEREIEEILKKVEHIGPHRVARSRRKAGRPLSAAQGWVAHSLARISLRQVMMWSVFAVIVAFFMRGVPGANWIMIGGLIVFVTAFLLSRQGGGAARGGYQKRWRGEVIDYSGPGWPDRVKAWLKGRKRG